MATGGIAHQFAEGVKLSKTGELVAVGSRSQESAKAFTDKWGGKPHGTYEDLLGDPNVDAVYIATPHHLHYDWTIKCAEAGKGILCEKPFTLNALEAQRALNEVRKNKMFFMEAFMYRCHPQTRKVVEIIKNGDIGKVVSINAEFSFQAGHDWANFRTDGSVGGGGLMDVGVYPISMTRMIAGGEPTSVHYATKLNEKGYDETGSGSLLFANGINAHFGTGIHLNMKNDARIYGDKGMIVIESPWKCSKGDKVHVLRQGKDAEVLDLGSTNGELYAYEADAVAEFWDARECPYMNMEDTIGNMKTLDALRATANFSFGSEMKA